MYTLIIQKDGIDIQKITTPDTSFEINIDAINKEISYNKTIVPREIQNVIRSIAIWSGIDNFLKKTRKVEYVWPRQLCHFFIRFLYPKVSDATIGLHCGNMDRTTVLHSIKVVNNSIETDGIKCAQVYELAKTFECEKEIELYMNELFNKS